MFPSPVPKSAFYQALAVQVHYNTLVDKISQDADFLQMALSKYVEQWPRQPLTAADVFLLRSSGNVSNNTCLSTKCFFSVF